MTPEQYFTSLTDQYRELVNAIQSKEGVFVIYGDGSNGKSSFIYLLNKILHNQLQYIKFTTLSICDKDK